MFKVEENLGEAIEDYAQSVTNQSTKGAEDLIKDIATEAEVNVNSSGSGGISRKVTNQGANISIDVITTEGKTINIKVPLLEEIDEGGKKIYRIVFENNKKSLDDISGSLTGNRKAVVDAINEGKIGSIVAKGGNANKHLGIPNQQPIEIVDIDVRTVDANGNIQSKSIVEGVDNAVGNMANKLSKFTDLEDKVLKLPNKGQDFLNEFANASDDVIDAFGADPDLLDAWVKMQKEGINPTLRTNPKVLKKTKKFDCK